MPAPVPPDTPDAPLPDTAAHATAVIANAVNQQAQLAKQQHLSLSRENAGVVIASTVVIAFVGIGFLQMLSEAIFGIKMAAPTDWMAAMLSLASAALGYLIGKQSSGSQVIAPPTPGA